MAPGNEERNETRVRKGSPRSEQGVFFSRLFRRKKTLSKHFPRALALFFFFSARSGIVRVSRPADLYLILSRSPSLRTSTAVSSSWERGIQPQKSEQTRESFQSRARRRAAGATFEDNWRSRLSHQNTSECPYKAHGDLEHLSFSLNLTNNRKKEHLLVRGPALKREIRMSP